MRTPGCSLTKFILVLSVVLPVAGCGGGKAGSSSTQQVSIQLNQATATLAPGGTQQFTATVSGSDNTAVTWTVDKVGGGNSTVGTITSAGLYTAPQASGTHVVTATAVADTTKSASATVTVKGTLAISPATSTVFPGATQQFQATLNGGAASGVTWAVDGVNGGNSTVGMISSAGLYTAPLQAGNHTISATIGTGAGNSATASVTVTGMVAISPTTATLMNGTMQQFTASAPGVTNPTFTWSVDGVTGGNSTSGTISNSGLYVAPSAAGNHTVTASDGTGTSDSASAQVTVFSFTISPTGATLAPGGTQQFTTTIAGITNTSVTWSVDGIAGGNTSVGMVSTTGLYTAPTATGAHNVTATSVAYPSDSVTAQVTVVNVAAAAVLTYHNDDARDGAYLDEVTLTPANVNPTQFGKVMTYPVDGQIYAQPLYIPQLTINGGVHDVVFIATQNNSLYAFDADATTGAGTTFWHSNFGTPANAYDAGGPWPVVGILSTPVIDATSKTIYIVAHVEGGHPEYMLHALDVTTGKDRVTPAGISGTVQGDSLGSGCYQRMGLALDPVSNAVYAAIGSCPSGWVFAYDKTTSAATSNF